VLQPQKPGRKRQPDRHRVPGLPRSAGEAFRALKQKEERQFGEHGTRRLVLDAWERQTVAPTRPQRR